MVTKRAVVKSGIICIRVIIADPAAAAEKYEKRNHKRRNMAFIGTVHQEEEPSSHGFSQAHNEGS